MKKISMIGVGKLGKDCAEVMAQYYDVVGYDVVTCKPENFSMVNSIEEAVIDRDIIFIAAPTAHDPIYGGETPTSHLPNKDFDYSVVTDILTKVNQYATSNQLVVLISTVLPGTVRNKLRPCITNARFIYNPYLIAMGTIKWDMTNPEMVIIGTEDGSITTDAQELIDFYKPLMQNNPRYEIGTWDEAESIKIFYNTFISAKIGLVNMIQDVAETNGNINVDVVTNALAKSNHRIMGPAYMKAGLGDGGACHPRDNIALRYLAERLDLGYDLFDSIMTAREIQAERMALRCLKNGKNVTIVGKAYKPKVHYTNGSASMLVGHYIEKHGGNLHYYDVHTGDTDLRPEWTDVYLIGYWDEYVERTEFPKNSTVIDPWRKLTIRNHTGDIIYYGDSRPKYKHDCPKDNLQNHFNQFCFLFPEVENYKDKVHLVYAGIHSDFDFEKRSFEDIVAEIELAISQGKTKIFFDTNTENFKPFIIKKIHRVAKMFEGRLPISNFFYLTGADNVEQDYENLCVRSGYTDKINIVSTNYFEWSFRNAAMDFSNLDVFRIGNKSKKFVCFNKVSRMHRIFLLEEILKNNLLDSSFYSFEGEPNWFENYVDQRFPNIIRIKDKFPIRLNITEDRHNPVNLIFDDLKYHDDSYFSVVTETIYYKTDDVVSSVFISEKTFRCIALQHPFIILGRPGTLKKLRDMGYKTFEPYIDERYDTIEDDDERLAFVVNEIKRLTILLDDSTESELWQKGIKDIVNHNKAVFYDKTDYRVTKNIIDMLNF